MEMHRGRIKKSAMRFFCDLSMKNMRKVRIILTLPGKNGTIYFVL